MIEKKRLEELIEQEATIYYYNPNAVNSYNLSNTPNIIGLGKMGTAIVGDKLETFIPRFYSNGRMEKYYLNIYDIKYLFEDKEEFDWLLEFGNIERTETLTLPTWEELFNQDRCLDCYTKEFAITKTGVVIGICLFGVDFTNKVIDVDIGKDNQFVGELTKENYLAACRLAKKLFLGEEI